MSEPPSHRSSHTETPWTSNPRVEIRTLDAHVAGESIRLVVQGFPSPPGATLADRRDWLIDHVDQLRHIVIWDPRGHRDLVGGLLTEPVSVGSDAGLLFLDQAGYPALSLTGVVAIATLALDRRLIVRASDPTALTFDTLAGTVRARATLDDAGVTDVTVLNVPAFVLHGAVPARVGHRHVRVDVAYGGEWYGIVDGEAVGVPVDSEHVPELCRSAREVLTALESLAVTHPLDANQRGVTGVIFTAPARDERAALKTATIFEGGRVARAPSGSDTAALMAVLAAMRVMDTDTEFVHEGLIGTSMRGRIASHTTVADYPAVLTELTSRAWLIGEHTFVSDARDPLRFGFRA